jgi:hypothetical protein
MNDQLTREFDTLEADLKARWKPSDEQIAEAAEYRAKHPLAYVYTVHLLVNKYQHFWSTDVQVVPVPGVFHSRNAAWAALEPLVKAKGEETGLPVTGGYTSHHEDDEFGPAWAVWEDMSSANQEKP